MNKYVLNVETPTHKKFKLAMFDTCGEVLDMINKCKKIRPEGWYWLSWIRDYDPEDTSWLLYYPKEERRFIRKQRERQEKEEREEKLEWQRALGFED